MKASRQRTPSLALERILWAQFIVLFFFGILTTRLWFLQINKGHYYRKISENNLIRKIDIPAPRGLFFDRRGSIILDNHPFFDLTYTPQYVRNKELIVQSLSAILSIPINNLERKLRAQAGQASFFPIILKRNLSKYEVSLVEENKIFLPGIDISVVPRRKYTKNMPAHLLGYMSEISAKEMQQRNQENKENIYLPRDLIGKQGLERRWENYLRGKRGYRHIQVDAFGRKTNLLGEDTLMLPQKKSTPGANITLTLDLNLQKTAAIAFKGKNGVVLAMNPNNGEILVMLSSPAYDPSTYQEGISLEQWASWISNPYKPLFDKTTGGAFPPGSLYKPVLALAALNEGLIKESSKVHCSGKWNLGRDSFHCHKRTGHGKINLRQALVLSCDSFFYSLGLDLGIDRIAQYAKIMGLGKKLGLEVNYEASGFIPSFNEKPRFGRKVRRGDIPPLSIGQGSNLLTPIQMLTLYAIIANGGTIYKPFLVKEIRDHYGSSILTHKPKLIKKITEIAPQHWKILRSMLHDVVKTSNGTGRRAKVSGHAVAGKTASVQVVSLKKNRNHEKNVSSKWHEHAMFAGFSPVEKAEIIVLVISENDPKGGGGRIAAPIAQTILEKYWQLKKIQQKKIEKNRISKIKINYVK